VTYAAMINRLMLATREGPLRDSTQAAAAGQGAAELLGLLEDRLGSQPWMLGGDYSLVDLVVAQVVGYGTYVGAGVDAYPAVAAWLAQVQARPAMQGEV